MNDIIRGDLAKITSSSIAFEDLKGSTVLISGASGFLARYIVKTILYLNEQKKLNIQVIGLVRDLKKTWNLFSDHLGNKALQFIQSSLDEIPSLDIKPTHIIHAASPASPKAYGENPVATILANTVGTLTLLKLASLHSIKKFLYFSSAEIYGDPIVPNKDLSETTMGLLDPMQLRSSYAESKRLGETLTYCWFKQYGIPVNIVRPFHTYGPGMRADDGRVFADFAWNVVRRQNIKMTSNGESKRCFCYLSDATAAFFTVLLKGSSGEVYNVGNPKEETSIIGLAELLCSLFPKWGLKVERQTNTPDGKYIASSISAIKPNIQKVSSLGWTPTVSLKEGFYRTIRSIEYEAERSSQTVHRRAS